MKFKSLKYWLFLMVAIFSGFACVFLFSTTAFAWNTTEWRPSVELRKCIDNGNSQINQLTTALEESKTFISNYESSSEIYDNNVAEIQRKFDNLENFIQDERPELEEIIKNSYAAYLAKDLLDEIIGSKIISEGLFHWGFITFIASGEDEEIANFVSNYYETKTDLENAIYERDNAAAIYQQSLINVETFPGQIDTLIASVEHANILLPAILEIENVYGAAGESRIEGTNTFCHPCPEGQLTSPFGEGRDGYVHHGCDYFAYFGAPIYAAADGVVVESGSNDSMGNYVIIQHNSELCSIYMHCSKVFVPQGLHVFKGDNIALVGSTGDSEGPHLHFQVEINGSPVNGLNYL